jgi:hypothetical protein
MTKKLIQTFISLALICSISALVAWCGGYDFDHRGFIVGYWVAITATLFAVTLPIIWSIA